MLDRRDDREPDELARALRARVEEERARTEEALVRAESALTRAQMVLAAVRLRRMLIGLSLDP